MTDREMLELAAKAAGYVIRVSSGGSFSIDIDGFWRGWNPLTSDGDALRLAVRMHMQVSVTTESCRAETIPCLGVRVNDSDENLATRRAVVMAASAVGKEMK